MAFGGFCMANSNDFSRLNECLNSLFTNDGNDRPVQVIRRMY